MIEITEDNYRREVVESKIPVLLDVYTPYCGPCKVLGPLLERLSESYEGKVSIVKMDGAVEGERTDALRVTKVPTLIAFVDGKEVGRDFGALTESKLRTWLDKLIS